MPPRNREPGPGQIPIEGLTPRAALVHVLTPEFQLIDPADFADIPDRFIPYTHPDSLRASLLNVPPLNPDENHAVVSYQPAESAGWTRLTVTSEEFTLFARHVPMLAETALQGVFHARDKKLRAETGNPTAQARSGDDWAAARRAAMRQVIGKEEAMYQHLQDELMPRIDTIKRFQEMIHYPNLNRGSNQRVRERTEILREYVFGDMLKAIGNLREWDTDKTTLASRTLQKRLYMDPDRGRRVKNFQAMLQLAEDYYGHKQAFVRSRIAEAAKYRRNHPEVLADVRAVDAERAAAKRSV